MSVSPCATNSLSPAETLAVSPATSVSTTERVAIQTLANNQTKSSKKKKKKAVKLSSERDALTTSQKAIHNLYYHFVIKAESSNSAAQEVYCVPLNILSAAQLDHLKSQAQEVRCTSDQVARQTLQKQYNCSVYDITSSNLAPVTFSGRMTPTEFLKKHGKTFKVLFESHLQELQMIENQKKIEDLKIKMNEQTKSLERLNVLNEVTEILDENFKELNKLNNKLKEIKDVNSHEELSLMSYIEKYIEISDSLKFKDLIELQELKNQLNLNKIQMKELSQKIESALQIEQAELKRIQECEDHFIDTLAEFQQEKMYPFLLPLEWFGEMLCFQILSSYPNLEESVKARSRCDTIIIWPVALYYIHQAFTPSNSRKTSWLNFALAIQNLQILIDRYTEELTHEPEILNKLNKAIGAWIEWLQIGEKLSDINFKNYLKTTQRLLFSDLASASNQIDYGTWVNPLKIQEIFASHFRYLGFSCLFLYQVTKKKIELEEEDKALLFEIESLEFWLNKGEWIAAYKYCLDCKELCNQIVSVNHRFNFWVGRAVPITQVRKKEFLEIQLIARYEQLIKIFAGFYARHLSTSFMIDNTIYKNFKTTYEVAITPLSPFTLEPLKNWIFRLNKTGFPNLHGAFINFNVQTKRVKEIYNKIVKKGNSLSNFIDQYEKKESWYSEYLQARQDLIQDINSFKNILEQVNQQVELIQAIIVFTSYVPNLPQIDKEVLQKQLDGINQHFTNYIGNILNLAKLFCVLIPRTVYDDIQSKQILVDELFETITKCSPHLKPFKAVPEAFEQYGKLCQEVIKSFEDAKEDQIRTHIKEQVKESFGDVKMDKIVKNLEEFLKSVSLSYKWKWGKGDHRKLYIENCPLIVFPAHKEWKEGTKQEIFKQTIEIVSQAILEKFFQDNFYKEKTEKNANKDAS